MLLKKWNHFRSGLHTTFILFLILSWIPNNDERIRIAAEMENSLQRELLDKWYPQSMDTLYGGFITTFAHDFTSTGPQDKMIVSQARHTWTNAKASKLYPTVRYYKTAAQHGFRFLKDFMWDKDHGGFYTLVNRQGTVIMNDSIKTAYGNAFGIYALSAYYSASGDTSALNLAKESFQWLEKGSHDSQRRGYYQHLNRAGLPVKRQNSVSSTSDLGYKDQNSSIHLLEAFTELYSVWPDPLVRTRLQEMLELIRDTITSQKGYLVLFFEPDWKPVSFIDSSETTILQHRNLDHVSFGHDVETAFLMLEASHALGIQNDTKTLTIAKRMVDHALQNGWDHKTGGFYDEGYYFKNKTGISIIKETKNWWAQAEGLNTLLLMADLFPKDRMQYFQKFKLLWQYAQTYLIDHEYGDWYEGGLDKQPEKKKALKGHIWKATYHQYRALANCIQQLRKPETIH
ncbi:MAG: AGE family epimerase/isomerase [Chitinophagaceae bacterium]|nr:AGE family epimerase/isomerase [Chitinophagaceae bacterium]